METRELFRPHAARADVGEEQRLQPTVHGERV